MLRQWEVHARAVRESMLRFGYSPDEVEHALAALRPLYCRHARPLRMPESEDSEAALDRVNTWVAGVFNPLMLEIAQLEIELKRAGLR